MPNALVVEITLFGPDTRPVSSIGEVSPGLVRELALFRCVASFQPSDPNDPLLMSASDGALDAVVPVAAHMPGGGLASINFILAARILLEVEETVVVLWRVVGDSGVVVSALAS